MLLNTTSLNLVKTEVEATLHNVEVNLGAYVDDRQNVSALSTCIEGLEQVNGAFRMINLSGAIELSRGLIDLLRAVLERGDAATDEDFGALGHGVMMLNKYIEHAQIKEVAWPQLLLPSIGQIQARLGRMVVPEGQFIVLESIPNAPKKEPLSLNSTQQEALIRRIRQMYQTGLIAVLRDQADVPHYRIMARALERAQQLSTGKPIALLWWVAEAMLEAIQNGVPINLARKNTLGQLDRQLKGLTEIYGFNKLDLPILSNCLYVVGISESGTQAQAVREAFNLEDHCLTQAAMTEEYELMCGPGGSVIQTVAAVLQEEMAVVKDSLDVLSRGSQPEAEGYRTIADSLAKTAQTLIMLGLLDASKTMREQSEHVASWKGEPSIDSLNELVDALLSVENAVTALVKQATPGASSEPVHNARISIHQLDEARALLVAESRSGLSLAKRAISSYVDSDRELLHLANVPATLHSVAGGLSFLLINRGSEVLSNCAKFIEQRMLSASQQPSMADLETLADAISSVDYYLESLEANKPIGESILDIAEDSLNELGYPVNRQKVA